MKTKLGFGIGIGIGFSGLTALLLSSSLLFSRPKIYYVRTAHLVEKFQGAEDARKEMKKRIESLGSEFERLKNNYTRMESAFKVDMPTLSKSDLEKRKEELRFKYEELLRKQQEFEEKAQKEEDRLINGMLGQINDFIQDYGEENKINLIIGTTDVGNVLYGGDQLDITEEILTQLNQQYKDEIH